MSYLVLARKYRPRTFADMTGQEVVTATLRGAIEEGRIGHAYLFCGPRGTGKTTTARIFAKCLNCEAGPTPEPCGTCERCVAADAQADVDVVEIDAASNTGVDHVRDLRDQAAYRPLRARFKVYIVDEVHMLSKPAFNAFLKTLEEPPPHVKFLFATTDPQKLPDTVTSRCQVLRLSPLAEPVIAARLEHVFELEGIRAEPGVARELARRARGGMRDALSATDQLLSLVGSEPKLADVARLSAEGGVDALEKLCDRVEARDKSGVLSALPATEGGEGELVSALLDHVRACLVASLLGDSSPHVPGDAEARARLKARGARIGVERLEAWLAELLHARERIRVLPAHGRAALELALLELCRPESGASLQELVARLEALESRLASTPRVDASRASAPSESSAARGTIPADARPPLARSESTAPRTTAASTSPARSTPPAAPGVATPAGRAAADASSTPAPMHAPGGTPARASSPPPSTPSRSTGAGEIVPAARPRAAAAGAQDPWSRALDALALDSRSFADLLRARGKLAALEGGRARVAVAGLSEPERALVHDARNQARLAAALERVTGEAARIEIDDASGPRPAAAERGARRDALTGRVAELFEGRIEDEG